MSYKLYYFPIRGRGEQIRLLLHALDVPFENIHVKRDAFLALREQGPGVLSFGSLPMLEDGTFHLCQGPAILSYLARKHDITPSDPQLSAKADSIAWGAEDLRMRYFKLFGDDGPKKQQEFVEADWTTRWLPNLDGLLTLNGESGFFVGDRLTHADIAVWDVLDAIVSNISLATLDGFPRVQKFYDAIRSRPSVAAHVESETRLS